MNAEMKTGGEVLIDLLEINGVDVVFGIPGVHGRALPAVRVASGRARFDFFRPEWC